MSAPGLPTSRRFVTQLLSSLPSPPHQDNAADEPDVNPLRDLPETAKKQLISLQVLFPNEFVPALDLLDRRLVTRFRVRNGEELNAPVSAAVGGMQMQNEAATRIVEEQPKDILNEPQSTPIPQAESHRNETSHEDATNAAQDHPMPDITATEEPPPFYTVYYVRSAQHRSSRYSTSYDTTTTYEVRLHAWNCSCPAFAFAAFPAVHPEPSIPPYNPLAEPNGPSDHSSDGEEGGWVFGGVSLDQGMPPVCKHLLACVLVEKCRGLFGGFVEERDVSVEEAAGWAAGWGD